MSIIGKYYEPYDNSYCRSIKYDNPSFIVQPDEYSSRDYNPGKELGAKFIITSDPYNKEVDTVISKKVYTFINVKSDKTGLEYRTLYNKYCIK